jgi:hypothetical protein
MVTGTILRSNTDFYHLPKADAKLARLFKVIGVIGHTKAVTLRKRVFI